LKKKITAISLLSPGDFSLKRKAPNSSYPTTNKKLKPTKISLAPPLDMVKIAFITRHLQENPGIPIEVEFDNQLSRQRMCLHPKRHEFQLLRVAEIPPRTEPTHVESICEVCEDMKMQPIELTCYFTITINNIPFIISGKKIKSTCK
jgi:hypothetical protein